MNSVIKLSAPASQGFWEIPILFEDEHLLALDKPSGLLVSPETLAPDHPDLMALLHSGIAENKPWARDRSLTYLSNPHKLDFETSGVLLLAKSKPVFVALADQFSSEKPLQKYVALVQGEPAQDQFQMNAKIGPNPMKEGLMHVDSRNGMKAGTRFTVLEKFSRWTLLCCEPVTARQHQIRVHLQNSGLPVVGDEQYGGKPLLLSRLKRNYQLKRGQEERPLIARAAVHAEELTLTHPVTSEPVTITAPWPKDLKVAIKYLKQLAG